METADKADELLIVALGGITHVAPHELKPGSRARTKLQMCQKKGRFGLSSEAQRAKTAYLVSWVTVRPNVAARWPHLASDILALGGEGVHPHAYGCTVAAQRKYCADTLEVEVAHLSFTAPVPRFQRSCGKAEAQRAAKQVELAVKQHAAAGGSYARQLQTWFKSLSCDGRAAFLSAPPMRWAAPLRGAELEFAVRLLLRLEL